MEKEILVQFKSLIKGNPFKAQHKIPCKIFLNFFTPTVTQKQQKQLKAFIKHAENALPHHKSI